MAYNYETDPLLAPHLSALVTGLKQRGRFDKIDNPIEQPSDADLENALKDSLSYLNRMPPESSYGWDTVVSGDPRLLPIVYKVAQKLTLEMLVHDWTHNGYDIRLEEFDLPSKLGEYQALVGQLDAEIERDFAEFKKSEQLAARGRSTSGAGSTNALAFRSSYTYRSGRGGWPGFRW